MDWQTLFNIIGGLASAVLAYWLNGQRSKQDVADSKVAMLERAITDFRIEVAKDYVTTHDLSDIKNTLVRIEAKLDSKQDK